MSSYLVLAAGEDFVFNNIPLGVVEEVSDIPYNMANTGYLLITWSSVPRTERLSSRLIYEWPGMKDPPCPPSSHRNSNRFNFSYCPAPQDV